MYVQYISIKPISIVSALRTKRQNCDETNSERTKKIEEKEKTSAKPFGE